MKAKKKVGKLIDEGCKLNKEKKDIEMRLAEIKDKLKSLKADTYTTKDGHAVIISEYDSFSSPAPEAAHKALKTVRKGGKFYECVKVQIDALRKYLAEDEIEKIREKIGSVRKYCFK